MHKYKRLLEPTERQRQFDKAIKDAYDDPLSKEKEKTLLILLLERGVHSSTPPMLTPELYEMLVHYWSDSQ